MNQLDLIIRDPKILIGKPIIKGTRISVELILKKLSSNYSIEDLLNSYPNLNEDQILACLKYASMIIANEEIVEFS